MILTISPILEVSVLPEDFEQAGAMSAFEKIEIGIY